jgi:exoribonuclease-2
MNKDNLIDLKGIARQAMLDRGFQIDFSLEVEQEIDNAQEPIYDSYKVRNLSEWLWSSIDNDDSRDLDQLEYAEKVGSNIRVYVAIADVSEFVKQDSATDLRASHNTTSIYAGIQTFPMLPERLSTDLSSLNENQERLAIVVEMDVSTSGKVLCSSVYPAIVKNKAQLSYNAVRAWLDKSPDPHSPITVNLLMKIAESIELQQQLEMQNQAAQSLREQRLEAGALNFQQLALLPTINDEGVIELTPKSPSKATQLIEEFMVAANKAVDFFLESNHFPNLQRVVRTPKNWERMVALADEHGGDLPELPNGVALQDFLNGIRHSDPERFPDLSLAMIKLMGRGEYVVKASGEPSLGHFGLALSNYSHSTAPNRRYADLVTQRLLHSVFQDHEPSYSIHDLEILATHCTKREDDANKVERQVHKSILAVELASRIGQTFSGFITGASEKVSG